MKLITGQFNDSFQPVLDGVSNVVKNYAYWLNGNDFESYVITPCFPKYIDHESFEVLRYFSVSIPYRRPYRLGLPNLDISFYKRFNQIPFDIVHAHCPFTSGMIALKAARKRRVPIIATFHTKYYDDFKQFVKIDSLAQLCVNRIVNFYNQVDFVWTVNKSTAGTLRDYGYKGDIDIVYNGTDIDPPDDFYTAASLANKILDIQPNELVLLFVGQHIWQKNLRMLVHSLYHLKNMGTDFIMLFAGRGYAEKDLKNLVNELKLSSNVRFLGLVQDRELLKVLFARSDLFLFPSLYDTSGIVIQEAAAMRCPALVLKNTNASEGIIDCYNGFLSDNDEYAYAKKIKEITSNKEILDEAGKKAQATIYRDWNTVSEDVKYRYLDIIKTYRPANI